MITDRRNTEAELRHKIDELKAALAQAECDLHELLSRTADRPIAPDAIESGDRARSCESGVCKAGETIEELEFRHNPQPMWIHDPATLKFLDVNAAAIEQYGYSRAEFLNLTWADIRCGDDGEKLPKTLKQLCLGCNPSSIWRHRAKDGRIIFAEISSRSIPFAGGHAMLVLALDVTQCVNVSEALHSQATMLDNAQKTGRMGTWHLDMRNNRLTWSDSTCALFGISPGAFKGTYEHFCSFILPDDLPGVLETFGQVTPDRPSTEVEYRIRRPDGEIRWMSERGNVEYNAEGKVCSRIGVVTDITEQRAFREKIEQGAALLRIAGRVAKIGGWVIEYPEKKLIWSDEVCQIHDMPPGSRPTLAEGLAMFPPEHRAQVIAAMEACLKDGTPYDIEVTKYTATGRLIWVRSIAEAVRNDRGAIVRLQGAFQDVTEHKQVELRLADSNRALRLSSLCAEAVTRATDEQQLLAKICQLAVETGGYRMAWVGYAQNDEGCSIKPMAHAGFEDGYLAVAKLSWDASHPAGRGPAGECIRSRKIKYSLNIAEDGASVYWREEAMKRGYSSIICLPLIEDDQSIGLLGFYSSSPIFSREDELKLLQELADNLAYGIASLRARSERQRSAQKIAQQAKLIDKATDAIILSSLEDGSVLLWSKGAERIFGWQAREVVGTVMNDRFYPDIFAFQEAIGALRKNGEWNGELQKYNQKGQLITVDCRWALMNDREERFNNAVLAIETDITEKKKLELQFLRAQRMESLGTLAGGIAHDLNNILSPIMISIQMLRQDAVNDETRDVLDSLKLCSERGAQLVRQVLSFARGAEGHRVFTDVREIVKELRTVLSDTFPKNIQFNFNFADDLRLVMADPTQLHQVLLNLCVNARDAMPKGGELTISVNMDETTAAQHPDVKPGLYVRVTVADTGEGMSPEVRERIFEPFYTTKEFGKGTGLGLSTVLGIVKSHGGFINVTSETQKGTTFKVYFPAAKSARESHSEERPEPPLKTGEGKCILVVDDEEGIRKVVRLILQGRGFKVFVASNGAEALTLFREHHEKISLVITDISMPVMDGSALIDSLRSINPNVYIIASSGVSADPKVRENIEAGRIEFIPKPYPAKVLLSTIAQAMAKIP